MRKPFTYFHSWVKLCCSISPGTGTSTSDWPAGNGTFHHSYTGSCHKDLVTSLQHKQTFHLKLATPKPCLQLVIQDYLHLSNYRLPTPTVSNNKTLYPDSKQYNNSVPLQLVIPEYPFPQR